MAGTGSLSKKRVLVLTHKDLVPPDRAPAASLESAPWKAEYDVVKTLRDCGHEANACGILDDLLVVREAIAESSPHIVFNMMEEFDGVAQFDQNVVSFLELLRARYTGCNPRGLMVARDKALAKKVLAFDGIRTPAFAVFARGQAVRRPKELTFPLIVKSLTEEASLGISQSSIVYDDASLAERVQFLHEHVRTSAIVEQYIDGRELYVGVLGNRRVDVFPVWELRFPKGPSGPRIATRRVKWNAAYRKRHGITSGHAKDLPPATEEEARRVAREAYRMLGLNGYARMDLRLSEKGEVYFIEANPNPHIGDGEDFAASAAEAGLGYDELLERILSLGLRWQASGD